MRKLNAITMVSLCACLLLAGTGCSTGDFSGTGALNTGSSGTVPYHAYGDSITVGATLADPNTQAYPVLLALAKSLALKDYGRSGDQACDVPTDQIFPNADNPSTALKTIYTVLISTNDVDVKGSGAYEAVFNLCHQAALSWLGTPVQSKVLASTAAISGASHVSPDGSAEVTDAVGASITFTFSHSSAGPLYLWYGIADGNTGSFSYALDGKVLGTVASTTTPAINTQNGTSNSTALLRLPMVASGSHTFVVTQTSGDRKGMTIAAIGLPSPAPLAGTPRVLVGTTPMQLNGGGALCNSVAAPACAAYIADITANVALLASDGLDVELWNSRKYMTGSTADMSDLVHPNALGHQEITHAITDIY